MKKADYPDNWPTIARAIREANDYVCQACGKQCRRPGELWLGWEYTLTVAHYDQEYDSDTIFVTPLCLPCHLRHDAPFSWVSRRRVQRARQRVAGQLSLL